MTKVEFRDSSTILVSTKDGESITLKTLVPHQEQYHGQLSLALSDSFEKNFSDDKVGMVYWVLMEMMTKYGFSFSYAGSDRDEERIRIGSRIKELREQQGFEAKQIAKLANIDASNLSKIEKGRYSAGFDVLTKIANSLGARVELVLEN